MRKLRKTLRGLLPPKRWSGFPAEDERDAEQFARDMALTPPALQYVMLFTPRSGSSWVGDVVTRTRRMGLSVGESFNPNFLPRMTQAMNASTLDEYCSVLPRRRQTDGVFGFQITLYQMLAVFGHEKDFLARYGDCPFVWLVRSDVLLQAISLYKMATVHITHSPKMKGRDANHLDQKLTYDAEQIRHWLDHILDMERGTEALVRRAGLSPLRMNYEHNSQMNPNHIAYVIERHIGRKPERLKPILSPHSKLATPLNAEFAERFRSDNPKLIERIEAERAEMLAQSVGYGPKK